jgi:signal transduction histidine kinase
MTVQAFGAGELDRRSSVRSEDEIGELSARFNAMADTIVAQMRAQQEVDRSRRELMANISHDLRNPLATIQGYIETLSQKDQILGEEQRRHYYEILDTAAAGLGTLIDDIFEISKLESPDLEPDMEDFSLAELANDVVLYLAERARSAGVLLSAERPSNLHVVHGNVGMLERVLVNVIDNAIRHTPSGGSISVTLETTTQRGIGTADRDDPVSVVHVSDTGSGIAPADLPHVFERFYIGDASRTGANRGSGLGLAICRRIIELHGGTISARSAFGEGTTVSFAIPASSNRDNLFSPT